MKDNLWRSNMKKPVITAIIIIAALLILFLPIPSGTYRDGGTKVYGALTYKIVVWNRFVTETNVYQKTSVFFFPDNFKTLDELWAIEVAPYSPLATDKKA